jgi:hypothetical protein
VKLRNLFEARAQTVGIIFGRFNPPHKGHRKAWEMASENDAWYVGTNQSTQGPKDPLPYDVKIEAMRMIYPDIEGHIMPEQSWLTMASRIYEKYGDILLRVYTDEEWVVKTIVQYNGKEGTHGFYNFKNIDPVGTPRLSSATELRNAVAADDRAAFSQAAGIDADTPLGKNSFFNVVKHYLTQQTAKPAKKEKTMKVKEYKGATDQERINAFKQQAKDMRDKGFNRAAYDTEKIAKTIYKPKEKVQTKADEGRFDRDRDDYLNYSPYARTPKDDDEDFRDRDRNVGVENERNNYAVYINGKIWKVFADPRKAMNIAKSLQMKGKDVEVLPTGAYPSQLNERLHVLALGALGEATGGWQEIYQLNKNVIGANPNLIYPGQKLKIPGGGEYTVKPGDNLSKIAANTKQSKSSDPPTPSASSKSSNLPTPSAPSKNDNSNSSTSSEQRPTSGRDIFGIDMDYDADKLEKDKFGNPAFQYSQIKGHHDSKEEVEKAVAAGTRMPPNVYPPDAEPHPINPEIVYKFNGKWWTYPSGQGISPNSPMLTSRDYYNRLYKDQMGQKIGSYINVDFPPVEIKTNLSQGKGLPEFEKFMDDNDFKSETVLIKEYQYKGNSIAVYYRPAGGRDSFYADLSQLRAQHTADSVKHYADRGYKQDFHDNFTITNKLGKGLVHINGYQGRRYYLVQAQWVAMVPFKYQGKLAMSYVYVKHFGDRNIWKSGAEEAFYDIVKNLDLVKGLEPFKQDVNEGQRKTMSRAAKGYEKYGKEGMTALAKAGRDGAGEEKLDKIRDKFDKYDEAKQTKVSQKPRQGPLKPQTGAGCHQDKKKDMKQGKEKHKKTLAETIMYTMLSELDKPSGKLYIVIKGDPTGAVRMFGAFANSPEEVEFIAQRRGTKDKSGAKMKGLKVDLMFLDAADAMMDLKRVFRDIDFVGAEAAEFVFKHSAIKNDEVDPRVQEELKDFMEYVESGDDPRMSLYQKKDINDEPDKVAKGVDHFIIGPDGKRRRVHIPGKPNSQMGGHATRQPDTFKYVLKRPELLNALRGIGFKFDGNKIIISQDERRMLQHKFADKNIPWDSVFGHKEIFQESKQ